MPQIETKATLNEIPLSIGQAWACFSILDCLQDLETLFNSQDEDFPNRDLLCMRSIIVALSSFQNRDDNRLPINHFVIGELIEPAATIEQRFTHACRHLALSLLKEDQTYTNKHLNKARDGHENSGKIHAAPKTHLSISIELGRGISGSGATSRNSASSEIENFAQSFDHKNEGLFQTAFINLITGRKWRSKNPVLPENGTWSFWRDWYQGFLDGRPLHWDLQRRVALIDDAIWDQGPEAVAEEIERIKGEFAAQRPQEPRFPAYEPNDLRPLIQNRIIATASLQGLAVQISGAIEQYHADTGANALPEAFSPLQDMPALMNAIAQTLGDIQQPEDVSSETEQALRTEIGRLNAKVADLEGKLSALSAEIESLSRSEKGKVFSLLRNTALLGGLISGLWAMSGDELGARSRYENIVTYTNDIRALLMKEGLPQTQVETSLPPQTRPDKGN
ncbi:MULTISPECIES: hypothetical protein [Rhodobacterales]|nr:hypothetical protein [Phaeobacter gallaeciensis]MDE4097739.1 hypothetical protein [Phaeobacter gallaeciensis]MDE4106423.1 hypothetical protein [Phaeobacter gallaeciensis]MDE4111003.1 hypothetical protein [Phaeobacter gallaeciensis]MDE4115348.1 hypothetical protein [Phaeobacter gallaeciensis]MDE4119818.1 hypothetical protein [Phaeobacter gallaeciensis]